MGREPTVARPAEGRENLAAAYLRLSMEERGGTESNSIDGQRSLIRRYMDTHGLLAVKEYVDDGWSGTNFNRPAFQEMMKDCRAGKIGCIVVKDLSRLGRNYIETGRYLERIFPTMGIRFIAVMDSYDSFHTRSGEDDLLVPMKNLINDCYVRDLSMKIRARQDQQRRAGEFIGGLAPFGYVKDPVIKNHLVIDEPAAHTVRLIFRLKLGGRNSTAIAEYLNGIGAQTPYQRKRELGIKCSGGATPTEAQQWYPATVHDILGNEVYTGTVVQGKFRKISYRVKRCVQVDREDWIRVEGMHEPIVSREIFDLVGSLQVRDARTSRGQETLSLLSGFVRCGECGETLPRNVNGSGCSYRHSSRSVRPCAFARYPQEELIRVVTEAIRLSSAVVLEGEELLARARALPGKRQAAEAMTIRIRTLRDRASRLEELRGHLRQDQAEGLLDQEEADEMDARFAREQMAAEEAMGVVQQKRKELFFSRGQMAPWLESIRQYGDLRELSREVLVSLVDYVDVFPGGRVEIRFRFDQRPCRFRGSDDSGDEEEEEKMTEGTAADKVPAGGISAEVK